jgi:hypothetical protein
MRLSSVICGALLLVGCTKRAIEEEGATDDGATGPGVGDDGGPGGGGGDDGPGGGTEPGGGPDDGGDDEPDPDDPTSSPGDPGTDEPEPPPGEPPEGITVWLVGIGGCSEGASAFEGLPHFEPDWDELLCEEPVDCTNNRAPEFGEPLFLINGMLMDLDWARVGDTVGILIPFADADCNLGCGQGFAMMECPGDMGGGGGGPTGIDIPCNTESSGIWIGFDLMTLTTPGDYIVSLGIDDRCMAGDSFELEFTL